MARTEVKGIEASTPANKVERLAISETATTIIAVIKIFVTKYILSNQVTKIHITRNKVIL